MKHLYLAVFSFALLTSTEARADLTVPEPEPEPKAKKSEKKQDGDAENTESGGCAFDARAAGQWALLLLPFAAFTLRRRSPSSLD